MLEPRCEPRQPGLGVSKPPHCRSLSERTRDKSRGTAKCRHHQRPCRPHAGGLCRAPEGQEAVTGKTRCNAPIIRRRIKGEQDLCPRGRKARGLEGRGRRD
jgi:hypothetical protein